MSELPSVDALVSEIVQTSEDYISGDFCTCRHNKIEHSGKCYGLDFNGAIWIACDCKKFSMINYEIIAYASEEDRENNS